MSSELRVDVQGTESGWTRSRPADPETTRRSLSSRSRRYIERLGPYQSLALLAIPTCIVEPLKLGAIAIAGSGHWITGTVVVICAYAASLLIVERLFKIVKPKLLTLTWFARLWSWIIAIRDRVLGWFR